MGQDFTKAASAPPEIAQLHEYFARRRQDLYAQLDFDPRLRIHCDSEVELTMRAPACAKEPETCDWIRECVKAGDVFYDVGANVGSYALAAASLGARVVAFEPQPDAYRQLVRNLQLNGLLQAIPLPVALGARAKIGSLVADGPLSGSSARLDGEGGWLPVIVMPLGLLIGELELPLPAHIKVDTDGGEMAVLEGLGGAAAHLRSALIECAAEHEREVVAWMNTAGMSWHSRHPRIAKDVANLRFAR